MNITTVRFMKRKASQFSLFDGLSEEQVNRVLELSSIVQFDEEEVVLTASQKTDDIFLILNGKCSLEYTDSQKRITPRVLSSNDLFGFMVLFDASIHTNKVIAITELICLKMDVNTLKKDQNLMDSITPNLMRSMMKSFSDSEDRMSDLKDTVQKSDAVIEDRVKPQIINEKLSKLTRLRLHSGRIIVISAIDMRRMRRDHITAQQLNDEHFTKVS